MKDVMIDVETLDTRPSTVILSIGACRFDIEQLGMVTDTLHIHLDIDDQIKSGRTVSGDTILWWMDQSREARDGLTQSARRPLRDALLKLSSFIVETDRVWGNGAAFDNAVLSDAFRASSLPQPWRFWNDMCYRTLKTLYRDVPKPDFVGVKHDALSDAVNQAVHLQAIYERMKLAPQTA